MIIDKDINPERDVYYLGAKVLEVISDESEVMDFFDIFKKLNQTEKVSMGLYSMTLDWLYILGTIDNAEKGNIKRCF